MRDRGLPKLLFAQLKALLKLGSDFLDVQRRDVWRHTLSGWWWRYYNGIRGANAA